MGSPHPSGSHPSYSSAGWPCSRIAGRWKTLDRPGQRASSYRGWQLSDRTRWSHVADLVGTGAVVVSLIYVGLQVRQNTAAIQTSTSQEVYQQHQEQSLLLMESSEMAEIVVRARLSPAELSAADSLRYDRYLNLRLNLHEAVYTNALQGTIEPDMAAGWLDGLGDMQCQPGMSEYWTRNRDGYHTAFRMAVDSARAATNCPA